MSRFSLIFLTFLLVTGAYGQTKFSEGSVVFSISVNSTGNSPKLADGFDGATNTIYVKGNLSRSELVSVYGTQSTIIDGGSGNVTVLKEYGDKKFMIRMTRKDWLEANQKYDSVSFKIDNDSTKVIVGYTCQKATGTLRSGETFTVYFTKDLVPANRDMQYSNRQLPGLVLEYESNLGTNRVTFTASKLSFDPVAVSKFDLPKTGFRVLTYEESKRGSR